MDNNQSDESRQPFRLSHAARLLAAAWGLAEATLFFIVPDVCLSFIGRNHLKAGGIACVYSLLGAIVGGLGMYYWGSLNEPAAIEIVTSVPAIDLDMVNKASTQIQNEGSLALIRGAFGGIPYKVYCIQAFSLGVSLPAFLLISIVSRLSRFILVTALFHYGLKVVKSLKWNIDPIQLMILVWIGFYIFYFSVI